MDASFSASCRWDWCTRTFPDHDSLRSHVEQDHIAIAVPVKRKDVHLLRRAEEGTSLQESVIPRAWVSDTDGSQSFTAPRVERAVMTDPILPAMNSMTVQTPIPVRLQTPRQVLPPRSGTSTPTHIPKVTPKENIRQLTFSELRGTPSPAPSLVPSSPGTAAIINKIKMTQNTLFPVTPRRSAHGTPHATPRTPNPRASPNPSSSRSTPKRGTVLPYTLFTPPMGDDGTDGVGIRAADPDGSVDIVESQLQSLDDADDAMDVKSAMSSSQSFIHSQWQPQSQLPLPGSLENSTSLLTTVDPSLLHAPLSFATTSQPLHPFSGLNNPSSSPSKQVDVNTPKASQNPGIPQPCSSAPPPPSPSTLDLSNITATDSQDSMLQTPSRGVFLPNSQPSPVSQTSVSAAGASGLGQSGSGTQGSELYVNELPFDVGFGYGYGDGNGETQLLQTQAPLQQSSFDSSEWSQS